MALPSPGTLAHARNAVFTRCTLNTGGDRGARALALVDECIRRAHRELELSSPWLRLAATVTIDLQDDISQYDFPDTMDPGRYMEVEVRDATTPTAFLPMRPDPSRIERNSWALASGRPIGYWFENELFNIGPAPDTDFYDQIVIRGYLRASDLVNDSDLLSLDEEAVVQRAELFLRPRVGLVVTQDMKDSHLAYLRQTRAQQGENPGTILGGDTSAKCRPQDGSGLPRNVFAWDASWTPEGFPPLY